MQKNTKGNKKPYEENKKPFVVSSSGGAENKSMDDKKSYINCVGINTFKGTIFAHGFTGNPSTDGVTVQMMISISVFLGGMYTIGTIALSIILSAYLCHGENSTLRNK